MAYPTVTEHTKVYPYTSIMASPYSCDPTGVLDCAAAIEQLKANQSNTGRIFVPQGTFLIDTDLTIPATMTLYFVAGGKFYVGTGVTLTVLGKIVDDGQQIFDGPGTVSLPVDITDVSSYAFGSTQAALVSAHTIAAAAGVELVITPGTWSITSNITFTAAVKMLKGAILSVATGVSVAFNGPFDAGLYKVFTCTGTGTVSFGVGSVEFVPPEWWTTNTTPGTTDMTTAIQAAINSLTLGTVKLCSSSYGVSALIQPKNFVNIKSDCYAVLKVISASSFGIFDNNSTSNYLHDITFEGLAFDGSLNYPASSAVYKTSYAISNIGIYLHAGAVDARVTNDWKSIRIVDCKFSQFSHSSIYINGLNIEDVAVDSCKFYKGSYIFATVCIRGTVACGATQLAKRVQITNNLVDTCGPQYYYDPTVEDYVSSSDGLQAVYCEAPVIAGNTVYKTGGEGIRAELCVNPSITGNTVKEAGGDGILVYNSSHGAAIVGNTIANWGKVPFAYGIRLYVATNVVAREFPDAAKAVLPADPTGSLWFDTWPYSNDNVNTANIIAYSASDYYSGASAGILPFRGFAGIAVVGGSQDFTVTGNKTSYVDTIGIDGGYVYASDFGFSVVHPVNQPNTASGTDGFVGANDFQGRRYNIFHPGPYYEPNNSGWGAIGRSTYANRPYTKSLIYSNRPAFSVQAVSGQNDNITAGSAYTVVWGTEIFDQGGNFGTNTFTAPIGGLYRFEFVLDFRQIDSAATLYEIQLITTNRTYLWAFDPARFSADVNYWSFSGSVLADMDAAETAVLKINQTGGANQTDLEANSRWMGFLVE